MMQKPNLYFVKLFDTALRWKARFKLFTKKQGSGLIYCLRMSLSLCFVYSFICFSLSSVAISVGSENDVMNSFIKAQLASDRVSSRLALETSAEQAVHDSMRQAISQTKAVVEQIGFPVHDSIDGVCEPNYTVCPTGWSLQHGLCKGPAASCLGVLDLSGKSEASLKAWERSCNAQFPCKQRCSDDCWMRCWHCLVQLPCARYSGNAYTSYDWYRSVI